MDSNLYQKKSSEIVAWYEKESQKIIQNQKDKQVMEREIEQLVQLYTKKMNNLSEEFRQSQAKQYGNELTSLPPNTSSVLPANEPQKQNPLGLIEDFGIIPIYVAPIYSGPQKNGDPPGLVKIDKRYDQLLMSNSPDSIMKAMKQILDSQQTASPLLLYILSCRLFDVGFKDDATFIFYIARDRHMLVKAVAEEFKDLVLSVDPYAMNSFHQLMGPFINGHAFGNIDKQIEISKKSAEWSKNHRYEYPLTSNKKMNDVTIKAVKAMEEKVLKGKMAEVLESESFFAKPKSRQDYIHQRNNNNMNVKYRSKTYFDLIQEILKEKPKTITSLSKILNYDLRSLSNVDNTQGLDKREELYNSYVPSDHRFTRVIYKENSFGYATIKRGDSPKTFKVEKCKINISIWSNAIVSPVTYHLVEERFGKLAPIDVSSDNSSEKNSKRSAPTLDFKIRNNDVDLIFKFKDSGLDLKVRTLDSIEIAFEIQEHLDG